MNSLVDPAPNMRNSTIRSPASNRLTWSAMFASRLGRPAMPRRQRRRCHWRKQLWLCGGPRCGPRGDTRVPARRPMSGR